MKFLVLKTKDPYLNLAVEEYLFLGSEDDIFMLWQNEPTVVIGKNQNAYAEINMDFIEKNRIHIARRITGGGAVYHDLGNLNYTFISSNKAKEGIDFEYFTRPIIEALASIGVVAELSGRNDLMAEGKKISGNAQHTANGRTLHHGTLLFDSDLDVLSSALKVDEEKIRAKGIKSTRSRVTNINAILGGKYTMEEFIELLSAHVISKYSPDIIDAPEAAEIDGLYRRNSSREWIFPERELLSRYSLLKKKRYPFGIVEIYLDMSNDIIKDIKIRGDFFGVSPTEELEAMLVGIRLKEAEKKIEDIDIGEYIFGITNDIFLEQLTK
ncbi:MAG: lipoate--protein ligase [Ruminococcaceae bacterium]|nr:lipoate--protein ligase [Oscillospiraceae bacterium]